MAEQYILALDQDTSSSRALLFDRRSGKPIAPAIVWQCRRTAPLVEALRAQGYEADIRQRTGLVLDAYFSATKVRWLLDHVPGARRLHGTDASNASRTMLYNPHRRVGRRHSARPGHPGEPPARGAGLQRRFRRHRLLRRRRAAHRRRHRRPAGHPLRAGVFAPGMVKNTYGTGSFVLMHNGDAPGPVHGGLLTTMEA